MSYINDQSLIRCTIIRGGTSKALFIHLNDLPIDKNERDNLLKNLIGSPSVMQIDGLGGANIPTSKVAIIGPSSRQDADVDYIFAQVGINENWIDYNGNCGNISSGVGLFALYRGIIRPQIRRTVVRINQVNTGKLINAEYETPNRKICSEGNYIIPGVEGSGSYIGLDFADCVGTLNGQLLPTGNIVDTICFDGKQYLVSIVDMVNPHIFVQAEDFGLNGQETAEDINNSLEVLDRIEKIRSICAEKLGIVNQWERTSKESPIIPLVVLINKISSDNLSNIFEGSQFLAKIVAMKKIHMQFTVSGSICTAVASQIVGSVVNKNANRGIPKNNCDDVIVKFGHPTGVQEVSVLVKKSAEGYLIRKASLGRTARIIMDGYAFYRENNL